MEDWITKMEAEVKADHEKLYGMYVAKIAALEAERDALKKLLLSADSKLSYIANRDEGPWGNLTKQEILDFVSITRTALRKS